MNAGAPLPPHLRTFSRFAALTGARPAPELPSGPGDATERFLALTVARGMFRAETNLRFIVRHPGEGTRFIHLGAGSDTAAMEASRLASDFAGAHPAQPPPQVHRGLTDSGRVPYIEVRMPAGEEETSCVEALEPRVLAAYFDAGVEAEALDLASELRLAGVACWFFHEVKNLAKHLRLADRFGAEWIAILGGREWEHGCIALRHAQSKEEFVIPIDRAIQEISSRVPAERFGE